MPKYFYRARDLKGEEKSGILEAKDAHQLAQILKSEGFILIEAQPEEKKLKKKFYFSLPIFGVSLTEKMFFTRNLRLMISAGLPLPRAIETLISQSKNKRFQKILFEIREAILKGKTFSESLNNYPDVFSELFQNMIKAGEESGTLDEVLKVLSSQMEKEAELKNKIKGAMIYPSIIILAMLGIGILMLIFVVPKLAETFKELEIELPFTTKIVIGLGNFLSKRWYLAIVIFLISVFLFFQSLKTKIGKRIFDKITLRIPVISSIIKNTNSAYTARTLSSLISAGITLPRALEITSGTLSNIYYKNALLQATEKVKKGEKLSEALKLYEEIYPVVFLQMLAVGEETGETSGILMELANFFEDEVANTTKNLTAIIEPILMLFIGAAVGFFAVSMIQPMYSMLGSIK